MTDSEIQDALVTRVDELVGPRTAPPPFAEPRRYSPRVWLSVAAAVLLVAAVAVTVTVVAHRRGTPPSTGPHVDPHYTLTVQRVEKALATTPVLPSSRRYDRSPDPRLDHPFSEPSNGARGVERTAWWTAAGSLDDAVRYFDTHRPEDLTKGGSGTGGDATGVTEESVEYGSMHDNDAATRGLQVDVSIVAHGRGVAVRVDATAQWVPTRSMSSMITGVRTVDVEVVRNGRVPTVHRTLTGRDARTLAAAVNMAAPYPTGMFSCGLDTANRFDLLRFTTPRGAVTVRIETSGCRSAELRVPGRQSLQLQGDPLDQAVLATLGLPPSYR